jgi:hypothetical protein
MRCCHLAFDQPVTQIDKSYPGRRDERSNKLVGAVLPGCHTTRWLKDANVNCCVTLQGEEAIGGDFFPASATKGIISGHEPAAPVASAP